MATHTRQGEVVPDGVKTGVGSLADDETKQTWRVAYQLYTDAPIPRTPGYLTGQRRNMALKAERTERINYVAEALRITRKQAKRRVKNYEKAKRLGRV